MSAASSSERYVSVSQLWMECTSVNACVIQHCLCRWSCRDRAPLSSVSSSHHNPLPEGLVDRSVLSTTIQQQTLDNFSVRSAYVALLLVISHIIEFVHAFFDFKEFNVLCSYNGTFITQISLPSLPRPY